MELIVGAESWPFPIPIIREEATWRFDTQEGIEELVDRRIGRNELAAIAIAHAYVDAQIEYATVDRNNDGVLGYAQRLASSPGKRDGLYWEAEPDEEPLVAVPGSECRSEVPSDLQQDFQRWVTL